MADKMEVETDQSSDKRGLFERFMSKSVRQIMGSHYANNDDAAKSPKSGVIKKEDGDVPKGCRANQDDNTQEAETTSQEDDTCKVDQQNDADISVSSPSITHEKADSQTVEAGDGTTPQLSNQEEKNGAINEEISKDSTSAKEARDVEKDSVSRDTLSTNAPEKTEKKSSSERKRKRKHSSKRYKSRHRSKSSKRRKVSRSIITDDEQTDADNDENESVPQNKFSISKTKAKIPKGCSVRHEATQKEELKEGSKTFESKKFTKIMRSRLHNHQVPVTAWMVKRERDTHRLASGGIIADDMGLGKTVVGLACIAANTPTKKERKEFSQATLVVVPNTKLANQWISEAKVRR